MLKKAFSLARWHHVYWLRKALVGVRGKLLDIGAGKGKTVREALKTRGDLRLVTMDVERKKDWQIDVIADGRDLPMKNEEFDGVMILDVLEHVKGPEKVVKEAARVLKRQGWLHVAVPLEGSWWVIDWWLKKIKKVDWKEKIIGHINHFNLKEVKQLLEENGFKIKWVRYSHHWGYQLATLIYFKYLDSLPKKELKPKKGFWLPVPWMVRAGVVLFGWLTVLESLVLLRVPGGEAHITAKKKED
jgi:SAM-dependent methyltransferase